MFEPIAPRGDSWLLGRDTLADDDRMSRRHCEVRHGAAGWVIKDLGSANGTHVNGGGWIPRKPGGPWQVLQVGRSLVIPLTVAPDVPLRLTPEPHAVFGPSLHGCREAVRRAADDAVHLMLAGRRGSGLEMLARHYASGRDGAFTVHDIAHLGETAASVPAGHAFVTGADAAWQPTEHPWIREVLARDDLRLILAVEWDPEDGEPVLAKPLRSVFRVVMVPPLEDRPEEIPWWIASAARAEPGLAVDVTFPEACLLRAWGGQIPGLLAEVRDAAARARARNASQPLLQAQDMSVYAGHRMGRCIHGGNPPPSGPRLPADALHTRETLAGALERAGGDRAIAARKLGITAETLAKWIRYHGLDGAD